MFEVEMKFRVAAPEMLEKRLAELGIAMEPEVEECDTFFRHPSRDFAQTDEGLRLRRRIDADGREERFITYKGPKLDATTKTRREIEIPLGIDDPWWELLEALGFQEAARVHKFRRRGSYSFEGRPFDILFDRLPVLPDRYVELETICDAAGMEAARADLLAFAAFFGLTESVRTSYLALSLAAQGVIDAESAGESAT